VSRADECSGRQVARTPLRRTRVRMRGSQRERPSARSERRADVTRWLWGSFSSALRRDLWPASTASPPHPRTLPDRCPPLCRPPAVRALSIIDSGGGGRRPSLLRRELSGHGRLDDVRRACGRHDSLGLEAGSVDQDAQFGHGPLASSGHREHDHSRVAGADDVGSRCSRPPVWRPGTHVTSVDLAAGSRHDGQLRAASTTRSSLSHRGYGHRVATCASGSRGPSGRSSPR
jgi:hypothetical protein